MIETHKGDREKNEKARGGGEAVGLKNFLVLHTVALVTYLLRSSALN